MGALYPFLVYVWNYSMVGQLDWDILGSHAGTDIELLGRRHLRIKTKRSRCISQAQLALFVLATFH
jgi:hypothetical protein